MSSRRQGNLQPAHKGYAYQDLATAYVLVRSIIEQYDAVIVDRKLVDDDRIDDLEVVRNGQRIRRQFKSSDNLQRRLATEDFVASQSSLRIDRLLLTHLRLRSSAAIEYRLCATWQAPLLTDNLSSQLQPISIEPTLLGGSSTCFKLRGDVIWPLDADPIWPHLDAADFDGKGIDRSQFLEFCDQFVIELNLPIASSELSSPGPLELALIERLSEGVGIGR